MLPDTESHDPIQIIINVPPETIYNHLVDFGNHVAWNHQLVEITHLVPNEQIEWMAQSPLAVKRNLANSKC